MFYTYYVTYVLKFIYLQRTRMETVQIIFQVLSVVVSVIAILQKQKWKMMLFYTINNILLVIIYFSFNRITTVIICVVATIRTFIFMFYSLKGLKPIILIMQHM